MQVASDGFDAFVAGMRRVANLDGLLVTMPHKIRMAELVDELHPSAGAIGAVNIVRNAQGRWTGAMFDGWGCVLGMRWEGHDPRGQRVFLIGAGGAGLRAAIEAREHGMRTAVLRVLTRPGHRAGAALAGPVRFDVGPGTIELGDWESAGLTGYSGGVRYRRRLDLPEAPALATLDLGKVRGTAEVTVNGHRIGVRICAPYTFDVGTALRPGANEIEVLVYGTLAPYLDDVSPTHFVFPGQRASGLFGPVLLRSPS